MPDNLRITIRAATPDERGFSADMQKLFMKINHEWLKKTADSIYAGGLGILSSNSVIQTSV